MRRESDLSVTGSFGRTGSIINGSHLGVRRISGDPSTLYSTSNAVVTSGIIPFCLSTTETVFPRYRADTDEVLDPEFESSLKPSPAYESGPSDLVEEDEEEAGDDEGGFENAKEALPEEPLKESVLDDTKQFKASYDLCDIAEKDSLTLQNSTSRAIICSQSTPVIIKEAGSKGIPCRKPFRFCHSSSVQSEYNCDQEKDKTLSGELVAAHDSAKQHFDSETMPSSSDRNPLLPVGTSCLMDSPDQNNDKDEIINSKAAEVSRKTVGTNLQYEMEPGRDSRLYPKLCSKKKDPELVDLDRFCDNLLPSTSWNKNWAFPPYLPCLEASALLQKQANTWAELAVKEVIYADLVLVVSFTFLIAFLNLVQ
ncbi:unnamed protein product [Protopolystoma xenopodis]|uniref:Uncharacterized protein n=1 Tax=Protopolystoma xenopodis TaxID=117903 RepID=A0A3S5A861_9PLAT|nr:unnamed protein product [Protopolystoma xenopodis]